jgi:hypothetical protein
MQFGGHPYVSLQSPVPHLLNVWYSCACISHIRARWVCDIIFSCCEAINELIILSVQRLALCISTIIHTLPLKFAVKLCIYIAHKGQVSVCHWLLSLWSYQWTYDFIQFGACTYVSLQLPVPCLLNLQYSCTCILHIRARWVCDIISSHCEAINELMILSVWRLALCQVSLHHWLLLLWSYQCTYDFIQFGACPYISFVSLASLVVRLSMNLWFHPVGRLPLCISTIAHAPPLRFAIQLHMYIVYKGQVGLCYQPLSLWHYWHLCDFV